MSTEITVKYKLENSKRCLGCPHLVTDVKKGFDDVTKMDRLLNKNKYKKYVDSIWAKRLIIKCKKGYNVIRRQRWVSNGFLGYKRGEWGTEPVFLYFRDKKCINKESKNDWTHKEKQNHR